MNKMKVRILGRLAHSLRVIGLILFLYAVLTANLVGAIIGVVVIGFDLWSDARIKLQRELHDKWLDEHQRRIDEAISYLTPEERAEYDRRLAILMEEFDRERQSRWARWRQAKGEG